jgi:hypothetical protein
MRETRVEDIGSVSGGGGCGDRPWESREKAGTCFRRRDSRAGCGVSGGKVWGFQSFAFDGDVAGAGGDEGESADGAADFVGGGDAESEDEAGIEASAAAREVFPGRDAFAD